MSRPQLRVVTPAEVGPRRELLRRRAALEERLAMALAEGDRELVSRLREALAELDATGR